MNDALAGFEVIANPYVPEGTFYLFARGLGAQTFRLRDDPFPAPAFTGATASIAEHEHRKAGDHLAGLLDAMCVDLGLDPDVTWREPRTRERLFFAVARVIRVEERLALTINPPSRPFPPFTITD